MNRILFGVMLTFFVLSLTGVAALACEPILEMAFIGDLSGDWKGDPAGGYGDVPVVFLLGQ